MKEDMLGLDMTWREVTCKRSVQGAAFSQGICDYDFSVSGKNAWIPAYSYFRCEIELKNSSGDTPVTGDRIAFADSAPSCLYNNAYFRAGGQDISNITQFIPQAASLKCRLDNTGAWLKYVGRDAFLCDSDFSRRVNKISRDGKYHEDGLKVVADDVAVEKLDANGAAVPAGTIAFTFSDGVLVAGAGLDFIRTGLSVGDEIEFKNSRIVEVTEVVSNNNAIGKVVKTEDGDEPADAGATITRAANPRNGKNRIFVNFQPPIGIFDEHNGIGSGDFKIQLNPNANYKTAAVEALNALVPDNDYEFIVHNVLFYVCQVKKDIPPSGITRLSLKEMQVLNKVMSSGAVNNQLDFTVPPSTFALTVFVQGSQAGTTTVLPPTRFKTVGKEDENLDYIQVTYGSTSKPSTLYTSEYSDNENKMIQRWVQSQYHAQKFHNPGGTESLNEYLDRGAYYHFDFQRDKNDTSTYVNVQIKYNSNIPASTQLFLVAHYTREIDMHYEQGYITQVVSTNR